MSKFVAIVFPNEEKIPEVVRTLRNMHGGKGIKLFGSAVVVRDPGGKLSVQEITKEGHGGAAVGALIGALAGVLGGPLAATIAAAGGSAVKWHGLVSKVIIPAGLSPIIAALVAAAGIGGANAAGIDSVWVLGGIHGDELGCDPARAAAAAAAMGATPLAVIDRLAW